MAAPDTGPTASSTSAGARVARAVRALGRIGRRPRAAYRGAVHAVSGAPPVAVAPEAPDPVEQAIGLLVGSDVVLSFERDGVSWSVAPGADGIAEELYARGSYSGETIATMLAFLAARRPAREWVVDVGANIGTTTVPFARAGYRVVAIEPAPPALRLLRRNLAENGLDAQVRVVDGAIATTDEVVLAISTSLGNSEVLASPAADPVFASRYGRAEDVRVAAHSLDDVVAAAGVGAEQVALVWSDTQGSEQATIDTGAALWAAGVPLFSELWIAGLDAHGGLDDFVASAARHFAAFVDGARGGVEIERLARDGGGSEGRIRPISELGAFAETVHDTYPGGFTDVLLLPPEVAR